jgi:predicted N-acyltransferase
MTAPALPAAAALDVRMVSRAADVAPGQWDRLARRGFHLHAWFAAAEDCGWRARHVAVRDPDGLHRLVPAYLTDRDSLHDLHDRWLGPLGEAAAVSGINLRPAISIQAPYALVSESLGLPGPIPESALHRVFEALEGAAEADGAKAVIWPCVDAGSAKLIRVARSRGYAVVYAGASARIAVEWNSFDEYLTSRSKNVRRTIRADLGEIRSAGLRTELVSDFRHAVSAMQTLYAEAYRHRNGRESPVGQDFFERLSQRPTDRIRAQLTWRGAELVGTSLNLMTPELLEGTLGAFAPEQRRGPAYYNDLCYEPIRLACERGIAGIDLGATALYAKVLRGAELRPRVALIRGTTRVRHRLLAALGHLVARRTQWKERRALGPLWPRSLEEAYT